MTIAVCETPERITAGDIDCVTIFSGPQAFDAIQRPSCAAGILHRTPVAGFQSWIDGLSTDHLPEGRLILRPESVSDAVNQLCQIAETPAAPERDMLINDIATLADLFSETMNAPFLRLRLERVTDNGCPKFHTDTLTARLVCTYRGPGTEYGISTGDGEPRDVSRVPACSPILMRGRLWPETPLSGFVHRSPPIEGTGETRLVLVLDPISEPDQEIWTRPVAT